MSSLSDKVAVVTGASRGMGKGIALALAEQGATVYVTGRTVTEGMAPLPGTVGETAAECDARGGKGIAVQVDHADDAQVAALFEQVKQEQGRLDILVNNAIAIPAELTQPGAFWEKPIANWEMVDIGLRAAYVAAWHASHIMVPQGSGLIVNISGYVGVTYTYNVIFGTCKSGLDRMARDMAIELKPHNVASISLWQGFTYTVIEGDDNVIGCVYIYPSEQPGFDAELRSWVRGDRAHLDAVLYRVVRLWLADVWPFTTVDYAVR